MQGLDLQNPMFLALLQPDDVAKDPYFSNVVLLLHMDGANNGTSFPDSSISNHTVTAVGDAKTSTSIVKFGSASLVEDGAGDYLSVTNSTDFDLGLSIGYYQYQPFTVEGWVRLTSTSSTSYFFGRGGGTDTWGASTSNQYRMYVSSSTFYWEFWQTGASPNVISDTIANLGWSTNTWYHVAVSYNGTTTELYFDGTRVGTHTGIYAKPSSSNILRVGAHAPGGSMFGNMDDFRMTKGVGRYTGTTITVPSEAFPNE